MLDNHNRECLCIEIDFSLPAFRVLRTLDWLIEWRGKLEVIRFDNDSEFISHAMQEWARKHGIRLEYIQLGRPQQNAYVERFNQTVR